MAAGTSSNNRYKTLDKSWRLDEIRDYVPQSVLEQLAYHFPDGDNIYAWGEVEGRAVTKIKEPLLVVDVCDDKVIQIFEFCFWYKTNDLRLQNIFGWDGGKSKEDKYFKYVYFLKKPVVPLHNTKEYYQLAFGFKKPSWLMGQRFYNKDIVSKALERTNNLDIFSLVGIEHSNIANQNVIKSDKVILNNAPLLQKEQKKMSVIESAENKFSSELIEHIKKEFNIQNTSNTPDWLKDITQQIKVLKEDKNHLEREHEAVVAYLFRLLGYSETTEIKYQKGRIDIRIDIDNKPLMTIEVKKDWNFDCKNQKVVSQAFNYANSIGTPIVITTNGDVFCIFDRNKGLAYNDQYVGSFQITKLSDSGMSLIDFLKKENHVSSNKQNIKPTAVVINETPPSYNNLSSSNQRKSSGFKLILMLMISFIIFIFLIYYFK